MTCNLLDPQFLHLDGQKFLLWRTTVKIQQNNYIKGSCPVTSMQIPSLPHPHPMRCARVNRLNDYQPGAEKQKVWRERLVGVLPGRKGSRVRCYPLKLTNSTGIMCRTKEINWVKSLECFKEPCVCAGVPFQGWPASSGWGGMSVGVTRGLLTMPWILTGTSCFPTRHQGREADGDLGRAGFPELQLQAAVLGLGSLPRLHGPAGSSDSPRLTHSPRGEAGS